MKKYRYHKAYQSRQPRKLTDFEKFSLVVAGIVFIISFSYVMIAGFLSNCVFHWPIQWNVDACWHEQIAPAQNKAVQAASNFVPN
jgi:hypothetical protein